MKIEQAKQLTEQALDKLIQALEAGKSETLKALLLVILSSDVSSRPCC